MPFLVPLQFAATICPALSNSGQEQALGNGAAKPRFTRLSGLFGVKFLPFDKKIKRVTVPSS
ncbi:hypothetical protein [Ensifer sp.]|uniref:hypothetical protein n=1 Tax=Ensifer sp. TaxID=1872086 RepID=UPI0013AFE795|nr:hypothetical protein [Ensifer sp.]